MCCGQLWPISPLSLLYSLMDKGVLKFISVASEEQHSVTEQASLGANDSVQRVTGVFPLVRTNNKIEKMKKKTTTIKNKVVNERASTGSDSYTTPLTGVVNQGWGHAPIDQLLWKQPCWLLQTTAILTACLMQTQFMNFELLL